MGTDAGNAVGTVTIQSLANQFRDDRGKFHMAILTPHNASELRRIIKESTGRDLSLGEAYAIWHYLIKLLQLLWCVENRKVIPPPPHQLSLFSKHGKKF